MDKEKEYKNICLNKNQWKLFSDKEYNDYVNKVFNYYRTYGFPYFVLDIKEKEKELNKLITYVNNNSIINDNIVNQTMHGLSLCWSYFPHAFSVKCNNKLSPLEAFNDDIIFRKVIEKRMKMGDNISDNGIRKMLKIYTNVQGVSNFRPTAACGLYREFANILNKDKIDVWDMSCGYGGRLLGAYISNVVNKYYGSEPSLKTFNALSLMSKELLTLFDVSIYNMGSEVFKPHENSLDVCFTSPPYFNTEKYDVDLSQSYIKYPTKEEWVNGFIGDTLNNCYNGLKDNGILAINIANVPTYKNLEEDFLKKASEKFKLINTYKLSLSSLSKKDKFKYEPIFIFNKKTLF